MASRERGENEGGRGGEIVTIALVPAGALGYPLVLLQGHSMIVEVFTPSIWGFKTRWDVTSRSRRAHLT